MRRRVYVADTNNHVIRGVDMDSQAVFTVAGTIRSVRDREGPGCPDPCVEGVQGYRDGRLRESRFHHPYDVALGEDGTLMVVDGDRLRRLTLPPGLTSDIQGIDSENRVVTLAGNLHEGFADGIGQEARFSNPRGVAMTADGRVYVADAAPCRIRRVDPADHVAVPLQCSDRLADVVRPEGCASYDPPLDSADRKSSWKSGHINYNYYHPEVDGFTVPRCMGVPPFDKGVESNGVTLGPRLGTGSRQYEEKVQTDDRTTMRFFCDPGCGAAAPGIAGRDIVGGGDAEQVYSQDSLLCASAVHAGVIDDTVGGLINVTIRRGWGPLSGSDSISAGRGLSAGTSNGLTSVAAAEAQRTFTIAPYNLSLVEVQTVAGHPSAGIDDSCGYDDEKPALASRFRGPSSVAVFANSTLTDTRGIVIADTYNNVLRFLSASCSVPCENGGVCVGAEQCQCPAGWSGSDCTTPVCSSACGANEICTGPDDCTCKPGFSGSGCSDATCQQTCVHGTCVAPDTCQCQLGWFDANCTTPVCD